MAAHTARAATGAPRRALPGRRALCTNAKKPRYSGNLSCEMPRCGRSQERSRDQVPSMVLTWISPRHRQVDVSGPAELASRGRCWRGFQAAAATPLMSAHISNARALAARYSLAVTWPRWRWERLLIVTGCRWPRFEMRHWPWRWAILTSARGAVH